MADDVAIAGTRRERTGEVIRLGPTSITFRIGPSRTSPDRGELAAALYRSHRDRVQRFLLSRCRDRDLADELTAETFACAVVALRRGVEPHSEVAWLLGIAHHKLLDAWRRQVKECSLTANLALARHGGVELGVLDDLLQLPDSYRRVLLLRYVAGYSVAEIAEKIGRSVRATESLLARARVAARNVRLADMA